MGCICFNTSVPEIPLEHFDNDQNNLCEKDWYAIFTQISGENTDTTHNNTFRNTYRVQYVIYLKVQFDDTG